jgi:hypothetical protein
MQQPSPGKRLKCLSNAPELLVSFEELNELMGLPAIRELEQRYAANKA